MDYNTNIEINEDNTNNSTVAGKIGDIKISDDVVASIAGVACSEVEGVSAMAGNITNEIIGKLGIKNSSKGVDIEILNNDVYIDLYINMKYGFSIPKVTATAQDRVKNAVENMTGLTVAQVDIHVTGIDI